MKHNRSILFILLLSCSCNQSADVDQKNDIFKVTLASQEYIGNGPFRAIELDSSLTLKYFGGHNSDQKGYYYGKVSQSTWDTIKDKIKRIGDQSIDTTYKRIVDDREIEFFIHTQTDVKHITAFQSTSPKSFVAEFDEILNIYKQVKLSSTDDSLKFETTVQEYHPAVQQKINFTQKIFTE